jgi:type IV pilus assembly protein PilC
MIVTGVVVLTIVIMMMVVVPQITSFLGNIGQELPIYTTALMAVSEFFVEPVFHIFGMPVPGGIIILLTPIVIFISLKLLRNSSEDMAYRLDKIALRMPVFGSLIKKISVARYSQTFGALFSSGITVLDALAAARETVTNVALRQALEEVERSVREGSSLSQAFAASGEFPTLVVRMLKVGEESGKLTPVLEQVSEFYTRDVDEAVQGLIAGIEPALTGVMGGMILWIAVAVFGPIYGSFGEMDF